VLTVLSVFSGDLWAGAEVMIFNLLSEFHRMGYPRSIALALNNGTLTQRLRTLPIMTHVIPESRCSFPRIAARAVQLLRGQPIHVIHSHGYKQNLLGLLLALILRPKLLVTTIHGLPELAEGQRSRSPLPERLNYAILRRRFTHVIAVSHDIKRHLTQEFGLTPDRITVIHNGFRHMDSFSSDAAGAVPRRGDLHIGTVGRLFPVKDFGLFLTVAARIRQDFPNTRFSILGDGPLRAELFTAAHQLGIADCFEIFPTVSDPTPYYRTLDLYLSTSRHEGIPLSILEAMVCAVPVVAPRVGGIPEVLSNGVEGVLVDGRSPEDLARACSSLLADQTLRNALGDCGRRTVANRFDASMMAARYYELYRSTPSPAGLRSHV
jgi:L-malate glycosyltransferase